MIINPFRKLYVHINSSCNHLCSSCILTNDYKSKNLQLRPDCLEDALKFLKLSKNTIIEISGGEPTLHPKILEIIKLIREYHNGTISLLTNGSILAKNKKLRENIFNLINEIVLTLYSPYKQVEFEITRDQNSFFAKTFLLKTSTNYGLKSHLKILITKLNYLDLPEFVEKLKHFEGIHININALHLINKAWDNRDKIAIKYSTAAKSIMKAADKFEEYSITGSIMSPMCLLDPYYWKFFPIGFGDVIRKTLSIDLNGKIDIATNLQNEFLIKPLKCFCCILKERCFWPYYGYIKNFGDNELIPIRINERNESIP